jgi:phosphatidylglycerophosphatase A
MKISRSAATGAGSSIWASGPAERIESRRQFSILMFWRDSVASRGRMESMTRRTELPPPGVRIHEEGTPAPPARTVWAWRAATLFGTGHLRPGPGTWASLVATAIWYIGLETTHLTGWGAALVTLAGALAVTWIGVRASTIVERESGRTDPGFVVIDEVAGQWVTLALTPVDVGHALAGFVLFRFFDIVKPWPVRRLERLPGGNGIMLDDVAAGVYGLLVMLLLCVWWQ